MKLLLLLTALAHAEWRLVGAYDLTAVGSLGEAPAGFVWSPGTGMEESCGPVKHPDGLGIFEAEAVGSGLSPALALVLEGNAGQGDLTTDQVRVALTDGDHRVLLQPMVVPRRLRVHITGTPGTDRYQQLVRTQLEIETCLEHKTGRAWTGQDTGRLRQAFLLDAPAGADPSRRYFGGQADPVPALLGAPDACVVSAARAAPREAAGRGQGANDLVPTDVWGASLRACGVDDQGRYRADGELPLRWSGDDGLEWRPERHWLDVLVDLRAAEGPDGEVGVDATVTVDGAPVLDGPLLQRGPEDDQDELRIVDVLARVPYRYPSVGGRDDVGRYTVLLVPEWQLVEALRRLERAAAPHGAPPTEPMYTSPAGVTDGVGTVLARPELLLLQVAPDGDASQGWPNLATVLRSDGFGGPRGYTVGQLAARSSIVVASVERPQWKQTASAQRAVEQALWLGSLAAFLVGVIAGLRRVRDLWSRVPVERAEYWPGAGDLVLAELEGVNTSLPEETE